jgi:ABC-type sugar transport system ATPase subunit
MARVELEKLCKSFGPTAALNGINIRIEDGEFLVIVGPSGCGKSTLLRLVAGLESPDAGRILFDGLDVTATSPKDRGVAMVFQSYALYPHWTVYDNIAFPLKIRRLRQAVIDDRVRAIAESLQLTSQLRKRPKELSGGQRQRVALGRAVAADPKIFLFDEPLSNLDAPLRAEMRREIVLRQKSLAKTALYVTHDQTEALTMADRIIVLESGCIMGVGTPQDLYDNPPNRFVAQFLGRPPINLITGNLVEEGGTFVLTPHGWRLPATAKRSAGTRNAVEIGIRPEHLQITENSTGNGWQIVSQEFLGDKIHYSLTKGPDSLTVLSDSHTPLSQGAKVEVEPMMERVLLFDPTTGGRLS